MVISISNIKGGVGKTSTCVNLACIAANTKKVLIYDLDRQKAVNFFFDTVEKAKNFFSVRDKNIDIFVSPKFQKKDFFKDYDIVFIDTPAGLNKHTKEALKNSDVTIVPVTPNILALKTYNDLISKGYKNLKILLNGVENKPTHKKIISLISKLPSHQYFKTYIPKSDIIENMAFYKTCVLNKYPDSNILRAYEKVLREVI